MMHKKVHILNLFDFLQVICSLCDTEQEVSGVYAIPSLCSVLWSCLSCLIMKVY